MLNDIFAAELDANGIAYEREVRAIPSRKFAYDFYINRKHFDDAELLIEIQGGTFMRKGGHNTGVGIQRDCEKSNLATLAGYDILHFTTQDVEDGTALDHVKQWLSAT